MKSVSAALKLAKIVVLSGGLGHYRFVSLSKESPAIVKETVTRRPVFEAADGNPETIDLDGTSDETEPSRENTDFGAEHSSPKADQRAESENFFLSS